MYVMMADREDQRKREQDLRNRQRASLQNNQPAKPPTIFPFHQKQRQVSPDKDGVQERLQRIFGSFSGGLADGQNRMGTPQQSQHAHSSVNGERKDKRYVNGLESGAGKERNPQGSEAMKPLTNGSASSYYRASTSGKIDPISSDSPAFPSDEKPLDGFVEGDLEKIIIEMRTMANTSVISPIASPAGSPVHPPLPAAPLENPTGLSQLLQDMEVSDTDDDSSSSSSASGSESEEGEHSSGNSSKSSQSDLDGDSSSALTMKKIAESLAVSERDRKITPVGTPVPAAVVEPPPLVNGHQTDDEPDTEEHIWGLTQVIEKKLGGSTGPLSVPKIKSPTPSPKNSSGFATPEQTVQERSPLPPKSQIPERKTKGTKGKKKNIYEKAVEENEIFSHHPKISPPCSPIDSSESLVALPRKLVIKFIRPQKSSPSNAGSDLVVKFPLNIVERIPEAIKPIVSSIQKTLPVSKANPDPVIPAGPALNDAKKVKRKISVSSETAENIVTAEASKKPKLKPVKLKLIESERSSKVPVDLKSSEPEKESRTEYADKKTEKVTKNPFPGKMDEKKEELIEKTSGKEKSSKDKKSNREVSSDRSGISDPGLPEDLSVKHQKGVFEKPTKDLISSVKSAPKVKHPEKKVELEKKEEKRVSKKKRESPPPILSAPEVPVVEEKKKGREKSENVVKTDSKRKVADQPEKPVEELKPPEVPSKKSRSVLDKILHKDPSVSRPRTAPAAVTSIAPEEKNLEELWDRTLDGLENLDVTPNFDHQRSLARIFKAEAEKLEVKDPKRCAVYLQSVVHFALMGQSVETGSAAEVYKSTLGIISAGKMPALGEPCSLLISVTRYLQCRTLGVLLRKIYSFHEAKTMKLAKICEDHRKESKEKSVTVKDAPPPKQKMANGKSPSPGTSASPYSVGSTGSGSHGSVEKHPPVPQAPQEPVMPSSIQNVFMEYQHTTSSLVNALYQWNKSKTILANEKDVLVRRFDAWLMKRAPLTFDGTVDELARHLYTGLWVLRVIQEKPPATT